MDTEIARRSRWKSIAKHIVNATFALHGAFEAWLEDDRVLLSVRPEDAVVQLQLARDKLDQLKE